MGESAKCYWAGMYHEWYCRTCKRTVTCPPQMRVYGEGCHDKAIHDVEERKARRITWIGLGLVFVGQMLVLAGIILRAIG